MVLEQRRSLPPRSELVKPALSGYPKCNILFGSEVDPQSKTQAFKNVLVSVEAES